MATPADVSTRREYGAESGDPFDGPSPDRSTTGAGSPFSFRTAGAGAAAALIVTCGRLWVSAGRTEYAIWPDEPAQLAIARLIGGGARWNMHNHSTWRPGFGTLLAPVYWFNDDPITVFRSAMVINAVLGGVAAWLLVLLARRLTVMSTWTCAGVAILISLSPAVLLPTDFVWSESLVVPLFLAALLALLHLHDSPRVSTGVFAGLLAAAAFGTHSRMLPLSIVTIGVALLAGFRRRIRRRDVVVVVGATTIAVGFVAIYSRWVVDQLWNEPSTRNSIGGAIGQLSDVGAITLSLAGQVWYLLVATIGIIACGAVELARNSYAGGERADLRHRDEARLVLVTVGACLALSVVFMADRWRPDQLVYGRYNDAVIGPVLLVGIAALIRSAPIRRLAATCAGAVVTVVVCSSVLWVFRRELLAESNGLEPMILGIQPFPRESSSVPIGAITAWTVLVTVGVTMIAGIASRAGPRWRASGVLIVLTALVVFGSVRTKAVIDRDWADWGDLGDVAALGDGALAGVDTVDFYLPRGSDGTGRMMVFQMYLPATTFTVIDDPLDVSTSAYVFAPLDNADLRQIGAAMVWSDPGRQVALWKR